MVSPPRGSVPPILVIAAVAVVTLAAITAWQGAQERSRPSRTADIADLPIPFVAQRSGGLAGTLTFVGLKNSIPVYRVDFDDSAVQTLGNDTIYVMYVNANAGGSAVPIEQIPFEFAVQDTVGGAASNYFGYHYITQDAATEIANQNDPTFTNRFPGVFFASPRARAEDAANGGGIAAFEATYGVAFRTTDATAGSAKLEPGSLYVLVVNSPGGARVNAYGLGTCGDRWKTSIEQCDDGNVTAGDGCSALCSVEVGWSCTGGNPSVCVPGAPVCGNGAIESGEVCDDQNVNPGDGCSATCQVESGWYCLGIPSVCQVIPPIPFGDSSSSSSAPFVYNTPEPGFIQTPTDKIPNFAQNYTMYSTGNGNWSNPATWNTGQLPGPTDIVIIPPGQTITYDMPSGFSDTVDAVGIHGTLTFSRTVSTRLKVTNLFIYPDGTLEVGTPASPIPNPVTAEIVLRDTPLNFTLDPKQYGNALIGLGTVTMGGAPKQETFVGLSAEVMTGDTVLSLAQAPANWLPGETIMIPDTRFIDEPTNIAAFSYTRSETATIQSVNGAIVTLSAPLLYRHLGARDPAGTLRYLGHVGNMSRNVIVRSENPAGTRGHILLTHRAKVDVEYSQFSDLGRTTVGPLDNTTFDVDGNVTHIGTNQIGRYAMHMHHLWGPVNPGNTGHQFKLVGNSVERALKWSMTLHGSHYGLVQDNIAYDVQGTSFVTEDGTESYNEFVRNFGVKAAGLPVQADFLSNHDHDGSFGSIFWTQGSHNYFRDNVAANARRAALATYAPNKAVGYIPLFRGANMTSAAQTQFLQLNQLAPLELDGTIMYSLFNGIHPWYHQAPFEVTRSVLWAPGRDGYDPSYVGNLLRLRDFVFLGACNTKFCSKYGARNDDYGGVEMEPPCEIRGFDAGLSLTTNRPAHVRGCILQNTANIDLSYIGGGANEPERKILEFRDVRFFPMPGQPLKNIGLSFVNPPNPWTQEGFAHVYDYNGVAGDHFGLFFPQQAPDVVIPLGKGCPSEDEVPPRTLTNQQCWDEFGVATLGQVAFCSDSTTHPEIIGGYTCTRTGTNTPPVVTLSVDGSSTVNVNSFGKVITTVTDDGLPYPPGLVTTEWVKVSGPGELSFKDRTQSSGYWEVRFTLPGSYVLHRTVDDTTGTVNSPTVAFTVTGTVPSSSSAASSVSSLGPLIISGIQATGIGPTSATIIWTTTNPSTSQVDYGIVPDSPTDSSALDVREFISHTVTITALERNTTYYYRVRSVDGVGNIAFSDFLQFTTLP